MAESYTPSGSSASYTVPELTDPADAPQAFRDFADSIPDPIDTLTVTSVTDHVTLGASNDGTMLVCDTVTKGGNIEVTVPANSSVALPVGFTVALTNLGGAGHQVKIKKATGVVIQDQGFLQVEDYRTSVLVKVSTDFWLVQAGSATYTPQPQVGLEGVGDWATITAVTGSPTTGTYTDGNGVDWKYYRWTGAGSVTTTAGLVDLFAISGGAAGATGGGNTGAGGRAVYGIHSIGASTHTVTIGAGGAPSGWGNSGTASVIGPINTGVSGINLTAASYTSSITGSSQSYGLAAQGSPRANTGDGGNNSAISGATGTVIIRVPVAFAQA